MDATTIGTIASLATTLIIAVTAFAALRQIRHNRMANELQVHLHFVDELNTPEMLDAIAKAHDFGESLKDPKFREALTQRPPGEIRKEFRTLVRFFERYASLVIVSGLSERLMFYEYAAMIASIWDDVHEVVRLTRSPSNPYGGRAFEHLAMRAKRYVAEELPRDYARLERDPRMVVPTEG